MTMSMPQKPVYVKHLTNVSCLYILLTVINKIFNLTLTSKEQTPTTQFRM